MPPDTTPERARRISRTSKLVAIALTTEVATRSTRQIVMIRVLPMTSATGPSTGCRIAYGNAKAVESSAAVAASTHRSDAILGITGSTARTNSDVAKTIRTTTLSRRFIRDPSKHVRAWMTRTPGTADHKRL